MHTECLVPNSAFEAAALVDKKFEPILIRMKRDMPSSVGRRKIRGLIDSARAAYVAWVHSVVSDPEKLKTAKEVMVQTFASSMRLGHQLCGAPNIELTNQEVLMVGKMADTQLDYLTRFVKGDEAMSGKQRANLYGGAVDAAFYHGWLAMLPATAMIDWVLNAVESCPDCLRIAAKSPYTKPGFGGNPLPTVPRNGGTQCLSNCQCFLKAHVPGAAFKSQLAPDVGLEVTTVGSREIDPTSAEGLAYSAIYQPLVEKLAWYSRMEILDPANAEKWKSEAADTEKTIKQNAKSQRISIRPTITESELRKPIDLALASGLEFVDPSKITDGGLDGVIVAIMLANGADRGTVKSSHQQPYPSLFLENGQTYRLDEHGLAIAFREKE